MTRWHDDANDDIHGIAFGNEPCRWDGCGDSHIHAFTDAELRARDVRIVRATVRYLQQYDVNGDDLQMLYDCEVSDIIIDAAEADQ